MIGKSDAPCREDGLFCSWRTMQASSLRLSGEGDMRLLSFFIGLLFGALLGATLVVLFAPVSGTELVEGVKRGYNETLDEARAASEKRRRELEAEFRRRRGR
jgi:hypothetical protein